MKNSEQQARAMRASFFLIATLICSSAAHANDDADLVVQMHRISAEGIHESKGAIYIRQLAGKVELQVNLDNMPSGWHAMHIHEKGSCMPVTVGGKRVAGAGAGPHYDPTGVMNMGQDAAFAQSGSHAVHVIPSEGGAGPDKNTDKTSASGVVAGFKPRPRGDLPAIHTAADGKTRFRILTYRLKLEELVGRSIMIHAYSEAPEDPDLPRGGGPRIACGVIGAG